MQSTNSLLLIPAVMEGYSVVEFFSASGQPEFLEHQLCSLLPQNSLSRRHKILPHVVVDDAFMLRSYLMEPYTRGTENLNIATRGFQLQVMPCKEHCQKYFWSYISHVLSVEETCTSSAERVDHIVMAVCCLRTV
jgi:hypothetical protein